MANGAQKLGKLKLEKMLMKDLIEAAFLPVNDRNHVDHHPPDSAVSKCSNLRMNALVKLERKHLGMDGYD